MTEHATAAAHSIDSIVDELDRFHQRATYGAVASLLKRAPRNLMQGRSRTARDSWIVSGGTGLPTGYEPEQMDPDIRSREMILRSAEDLGAWLENPV
jgi:hypothetical protein